MDVLATLGAGDTELVLRRAIPDDLPALVALLADDQLGASREAVPDEDEGDAESLRPYRRAFETIDADPAQLLVAAVRGDEVVGMLQLTVIPGLSRGGALRAQIEAVRIRSDVRSQGHGEAMIGWAVREARRRGCLLVQLTTDKSRAAAHRFYLRLGFVASHEGMKLHLG